MKKIGIDFRSFFEDYFQKHDESFLINLGETIKGKEDPKEIAALADWSFRNYMVESVSVALELNNEKIHNDINDLIEKNISGFIKSEHERLETSKKPQFHQEIPENPVINKTYQQKESEMPETVRKPQFHQGIKENPLSTRTYNPREFEIPGSKLPSALKGLGINSIDNREAEETSSQQVDFNFEA